LTPAVNIIKTFIFFIDAQGI